MLISLDEQKHRKKKHFKKAIIPHICTHSMNICSCWPLRILPSRACALRGNVIVKLKERKKIGRGNKWTPGLYLSGRLLHLVVYIFDFLFEFFKVVQNCYPGLFHCSQLLNPLFFTYALWGLWLINTQKGSSHFTARISRLIKQPQV